MTKWHINKDDLIINSIVAGTKEIAQQLYPDCEIIEDPGYIAFGWIKTADGWRPEYPNDGKEYEWSEEIHEWCFVEPSNSEE